MKLSEHQCAFTDDLAKLIMFAHRQPGYRVAVLEVWRSPETAMIYAQTGRGIVKSLHRDACAADLKLYIDGSLQRKSEPYALLGEYWESLNILNRWGGTFSKPDGGHFERRYQE